MTRRTVLLLILAWILFVNAIIPSATTGVQPSHHEPIPFGLFSPLTSPTQPSSEPTFTVAKQTPKPSPTPLPKVAPKATPRPARPILAHALSGRATWYCGSGSPCTRGYPSGMYAAAGPALRAALGDWRGRTVVVCRKQSCIAVRLIDSCVCASVVDLYADAFSQLAPLSTGVIPVTISRQTP